MQTEREELEELNTNSTIYTQKTVFNHANYGKDFNHKKPQTKHGKLKITTMTGRSSKEYIQEHQ